MDQTNCAICGNSIAGILLTQDQFSSKPFKLSPYHIGYLCQNCGTAICTTGKKKDHPYGKFSLRKKTFLCPGCGEEFVHSHLIFKEDVPINLELREILGDKSSDIDPATFNRIMGKMEEKKWRKDPAIKEELLENLKIDGLGIIYRCLEELICEIEDITPTIAEGNLTSQNAKDRIIRIIWLAEIGASWLFEDGIAEKVVIYIIENLKNNFRGSDRDGTGEYSGSIFDLLMVALWRIEEAAKSGNPVTVLTNILLNDEAIYYRSLAALTLQFIPWDPRAVDALIEALSDTERPSRPAGGSLITPYPPSVQERAVVSLMKMGDEHGLAAVIPIIGKKGVFAGKGFVDIEYNNTDSSVLLAEIGQKHTHLLVEELKKHDKDELRKDITKNIGELTLIDQINKALEQLNTN